ncbi:uncharacterized protein LOC129566188 [Sitodiplosis mosellana]|uniref:uncharacterized protein LOC129566188 n=1 Tax=Sitodiplosis mosellana TaxID=263140 RepID=UPI00244444A2|nr:uncharacterized protein LOC129566188 [Sitodiplosis mosellana]XP_055297872.1 uncharacterized protein LOC129566188 [Sitodiplosis mosellana]XP_055297873.1 uncharacterized protein LOC129566188 [Sitodiplosis mosellana]
MSNHHLLSGNPWVVEEKFAEMDIKDIKKEILHVEIDSKAYLEHAMYHMNDARTSLLLHMPNSDNYLIASSKMFLANMRQAITAQNEYIDKFSVDPDPDESNELKIASKGWYNLLLRQLMQHRIILANARALGNQDCGYLVKLESKWQSNWRLQERLRRDMNARYP